MKVYLIKGKPPIFAFSGNENFSKPGRVSDFRVYKCDESLTIDERVFWCLEGDYDVKVTEIVYGRVPAGFEELVVARPLEANAEYCVEAMGFFSDEVAERFTYRP